jgi:glutaredoxin
MAIILYTLPGCPYCAKLRNELALRGVAYAEVDLVKRKASVTELVKLTNGRRVVPVLVEAGRVLIAPDGGTDF